MSDEERRAAITQRMKERGMSDAEIKERLAQFAAGGGPGGGRGGGGKKGGARKSDNTVSYVLVGSDDPENPEQLIVKIGMTDGSYTEILEGLEEGDEVLIRKVSLGSGKQSGGSLFSPSIGRGGGRR